MIELWLILGIDVGGLVLALLLARWLAARDAGGAEVRRLAAAMERASSSFRSRQGRFVAAGAALLAAGAFLANAFMPGAPGLAPALWHVFGVGAGAALAFVAAHAVGTLARRAAVRVPAAARTSLDGALSLSMRAAGAGGLLVEALSMLSTAGLFAAAFAVRDGFRAAPAEAADAALGAALLLPSLALGAVAAALVVQRGGAAYHAAADVGGELAAERDAGLEHDHAQNPAVISDLVGDHVGLAAPRAADLFVSATLANVAAVIVGALAQASNAGELTGPTAVVLLPLLVRAFGVIGSACGVLVVRSDEQRATEALWRGQATATIVSLGGLAGATLWLLPAAHWLRFSGAGAAAVAGVVLAAHATRYRAVRRVGPLREVLDTLRVGEGASIPQGLGAGLEAALVPVLVAGSSLALAWQLGAGSGLELGGMLAVTLAVGMLLAPAPYVLAVATLSPISDSASGIASVSIAADPADDASRRIGRLDETGFVAAAVARTYLVLAGGSAALLGGALLPLIAGQAGDAAALDVTHPAVAWSGALGAAAVLAYAGNCARAASRGARGIALEVERQLRGFQRESGRIRVPAEFTPSYRSCIELAEKSALDRLFWPASLALLLPALLGIVLRLMYRSSDPGLVTQGLTAFVVVASVTGLAAALAADGARVTLGAARRASRPGGLGPAFTAALSGDAVADVLGNVSGPAAQLLIKGAAITALVAAPFLI